MYVPYFYGSQFELLAIRALAPKIATASGAGKLVVPLIEPVRLNQSLSTSLPLIGQSAIPFFLVVNPQSGEVVGDIKGVHNATFGAFSQDLANSIPTYIVTEGTTATDINTFATAYPSHSVAFVVAEWVRNASAVGAAINAVPNLRDVLYVGQGALLTNRQHFTPTTGVLIEDGFKKKGKNAEYGTSSHFSDLHNRYKVAGYTGFGDYTTVGEGFSGSGGPAAAVAIHVTEKDVASGTLNTLHFVSTAKTGAGVNVSGKFVDAVQQLRKYVSTPPPRKFPYSDAVTEFVDLANRAHFPNLGKSKELSMRHHLELMIDEVL